MTDRLKVQRDHFDKLYTMIRKGDSSYGTSKSQSIPLLDGLLVAEARAERNYVDGVLIGKIIGLELRDKMQTILEGFENSVSKVSFEKRSLSIVANPPFHLRAISDCFLEHGLDYIDRWVMYNQLFGETK
jgi:hypothetical protein